MIYIYALNFRVEGFAVHSTLENLWELDRMKIES